MNTMLELRKLQLHKRKNLSFEDFHALVCKSMPDATRFPEIYNLCYELMKASWETAQKQIKD
jgi:hypothetical protein